MISVILNKYKREHLFEKQLESINSQSIKVDEIIVVDNSKKNLGLYSRWANAICAKNEFICVIDDDTFPGRNWLKNCFENFEEQEGVYGACGYLFNSDKKFENNYIRYGSHIAPLNFQNEKRVQVDYVVHNWFLKKEWLKYYFNYIPSGKYWNCGDDMNMAIQLQKQNINCYVPPHPINDKSLWGSVESNIGIDSVSIWEANEDNWQQTYIDFWKDGISNGWQLINSKKSTI